MDTSHFDFHTVFQTMGGLPQLRAVQRSLRDQRKALIVTASEVVKRASLKNCAMRLSADKKQSGIYLLRWRVNVANGRQRWVQFESSNVAALVSGYSVAVRRHLEQCDREVREINVRFRLIQGSLAVLEQFFGDKAKPVRSSASLVQPTVLPEAVGG
ncbi:MAG: hypothetical protein QM533_11565 [Cytophagales bacterium]|nr:hypothetical protein [Cytophagales bacterium]